MPAAPALSPAGRQVLAEADERDQHLVVSTGLVLADIRAAYTAMTPSEREQVVIDGFRWRRYWRPEQVALREDLEDLERRRLQVESSHAISAAIGRVGPSHAELERRRAIPGPISEFDPVAAAAWVRNGAPTTNYRKVA